MIPTVGAAVAPTQPSAAGTGLGALDGNAFLKLMVAQLRYQNPLEPTDASTMMQQTAAFTQVETLQKLAATQQTMLGMSEALMATGFVGRQVSVVRSDDSVLSGVVDSVRFTTEGPLLAIAGEEVPMTAVVQIATPPAAPAATADPGSTADPNSAP